MVATSGCNCPAVSPYPSCQPTSDTIDCKILYYMGENNIDFTGEILLPGVLSELYVSDKEDWKIFDYNVLDLYKSAILPPLSNADYWNEKFPEDHPKSGQCKHRYFESFTLTERELLFSQTLESWELYGTTWLHGIGGATALSSIPDCKKPFSILVFQALGIDMILAAKEAAKAIFSLEQLDTSKTGAIQNQISIIGDFGDTNEEQLLQKRKEACWSWFKNIADTYYGKKFLVSIGNESPATGGFAHNGTPGIPQDGLGFDFRGICVKDKYGNYPTYGKGGYSYYIKGNGSGQGFSVSDEISNDGGFPSKNINDILGLSGIDLDFVKTEDGKIESFVKVGYVTNPDGSTKTYTKFQNTSTTPDPDQPEEKWYLNFTKLNPENYFIKDLKNENDEYNGSILYIKASVDDKIYFIGTSGTVTPLSFEVQEDQTPPDCPIADNSSYCQETKEKYKGQWALISLSEQIPLSLYGHVSSYGALSIMKAIYALTQDELQPGLIGSFKKGLKIISETIVNAAQSIAPYTSPAPFGALPSIAQLNILQVADPAKLPIGAVIPMKSNLYSYGPYYYDGSGEKRDNTGGTEFIKQDILAPWNFAIKDNGEYNISYAYDAMDCAGAKLAADSSRGLQQLEKGRITLAELPSYSLGHSVDDVALFPDEDGPTILTDINVDYGSGGFRTTYNFQTFTPKFGRDSKKLLDRLNQKIKENNNNTAYLKQQRLKESSAFKTLQRSVIDEQIGRRGEYNNSPIFNKKSTPHKLLISGYYLRFDDLDNSPGNFPWTTPEPSVGCGNPYQDEPFDPCKKPKPLPSPDFSPGPSKDRLYTFAETSEAYQSTYIQQTYKHLHIMSTDGLYLPVSLKGDCAPSPSPPNCSNTGRIPRFSMRTENNGQYVEWKDSTDLQSKVYNAGYPNPSKSRDEIPPFKLIGSYKPKAYSLPINQLYLNPITSSKILEDWDNRKNDTTKGFVISSIAFGNKFTDYQLTHNDLGKDSEGNPLPGDDEILRQQQDNFRFSALRGPLVLQGWGYDTAGKPIPNYADTAYHAERGKFKKCGLTDKFMQGWIENPRTWPVGPVDLRFDRERGVWTCPSPNKIVVARLKQTLRANGKAQAELINPQAADITFYQNYNISGPDGENVKLRLQNAIIVVYDFIGAEISANDLVYAYYDDNRYIVLESGRAYKGTGQNKTSSSSEDDMYWDIVCTTQTTTTPTTPPCSWYGLDDLKNVKYYDMNRQQVLGHDNKGCLIWINTTEC